ncbi:MAG: MFS transporter, partial [Vicinamibacterales bacterium]
ESLGPRLYAIRVLDGAAAAMWYTALFTQAADLVPVQRRIEGLAMFGISGLLPVAAGAQFGDAILALATYREVFLGALGLAVFGGVLCLRLENVRSEHARPGSPRSVRATAAERDLVPVWLAGFAFFVAVAAIFGFMKTFVLETGLGRVGTFFTAYAGVAVSLRIFLGWLPDQVGAHRTLGLAMSAYAAGLLVLAVANSPALVVVAALLCGAGHGYSYPVLLSLVVGRTHYSERGVATAFFTSLDWLAHLVAGPAVGYVIEDAGYGEAFTLLAALLMIGIAVFYAIDRRPLPGA